MDKSQIDDETMMFIVISDIGGIDGPFFTLARAVELAEVSDGSVFKLERVDDDDGEREATNPPLLALIQAGGVNGRVP
jgi:hypothetical protein